MIVMKLIIMVLKFILWWMKVLNFPRFWELQLY